MIRTGPDFIHQRPDVSQSVRFVSFSGLKIMYNNMIFSLDEMLLSHISYERYDSSKRLHPKSYDPSESLRKLIGPQVMKLL